MMPESVWPYDVLSDGRVEPPMPTQLTCFVLIRSRPQGVWDDMFALIENACQQAKGLLQLSHFDVIRATDIVSPGVIHHEIWDQIKRADIVIADLTGHNPNVMFELGVAAASKSKQRVILIRELSDEPDAFPFDMMPARHITYTRTLRGLSELVDKLAYAVFQALAGAPFDEIASGQVIPQLPFSAPLTDGRDSPAIWTSDHSHRRMLPDCLEFGSLYAFRYSWASVGNLKLSNVRVRAQMRLTLIGERPEHDEWIGVSVRDQGFYANLGWLVHVRRNGEVAFTLLKSERFDMDVPAIGNVKPLDERTDDEYVTFDVSVTESKLAVRVDESYWEQPLAEMPYVPTRGRVVFKAAFARAGLRHVYVDNPDAL